MFAGASPSEPVATTTAAALAGVRVRGGLRIACCYRDAETRITDLEENGGWRMRFPELHHRQFIEAVSINTGGGIIGGDHVSSSIDVAGGHLVLTTQAAERIYRSLGPPAHITADISLGPGAALDWLPQETILFSGSALSRRYDITMTGTSRLLLLEQIILGRTASGETLHQGQLDDQWRIRRDGRLVFAEAIRLNGDVHAHMLRAATGGAARAIATLLLMGPDAEERLDAVRASISGADLDCGASTWNGILVARFVARDAALLRRCLVTAAQAASGRAMPRVWSL